METRFSDDLLLLKNALRAESFRFILIEHNHPSVYENIRDWTHEIFTSSRKIVEFALAEASSATLQNAIVSSKKGILLIPDFDALFRDTNATQCTYFNQRRDYFAKLDISFICFIQPNTFPTLIRKLPDWWSLRSLELSLLIEQDELLSTSDFQLKESINLKGFDNLTLSDKKSTIEDLHQQISFANPNNKSLLSSLYYQLGRLYYYIEDYFLAEKYLEKAHQFYIEIKNLNGLENVLISLGALSEARGEYDKALKYLEKSLIISEENSNKELKGRTLGNLGQVYISQGEYKKALPYLEKSLMISQEMNDNLSKVDALGNIGAVFDSENQLGEALSYFKKSLKLSREIEDYRREGVMLNNIASIYNKVGEYEKALSVLQNSLQISRKIGNTIGQASTLHNLGYSYYKQKKYETAISYLVDASQLLRELGSSRLKFPEEMLQHIQEEIGETRSQEIISKLKSKEEN